MRLIHSDCLSALKSLDDCSVDSIVTDPPYGLGMSKKGWDNTLPGQEIWRECFRVLKPGGHILAFASARYYHHLAVAIENVGITTFNMLGWVYGSGLPKGRSLSKEFDRENVIPKPDDHFRAYLRSAIKRKRIKIIELERICNKKGHFCHYLGKSQAAYPPLSVWLKLKELLDLDDTFDKKIEEVEALRKNLKDSQKIGSPQDALFSSFEKRKKDKTELKSDLAKKWDGWKYGAQTVRPSFEPIYFGQKPPQKPMTDNILKWGVGAININDLRFKGADNKVRELSSIIVEDHSVYEQSDFPVSEGIKNTLFSLDQDELFFVPKPSKQERNGNKHPTIKPVELMRRLVRLITPKGGVCLDPFMGSGTTGVACLLEEIDFIGIEREREYFEISERRLAQSLDELIA